MESIPSHLAPCNDCRLPWAGSARSGVSGDCSHVESSVQKAQSWTPRAWVSRRPAKKAESEGRAVRLSCGDGSVRWLAPAGQHERVRGSEPQYQGVEVVLLVLCRATSECSVRISIPNKICEKTWT